MFGEEIKRNKITSKINSIIVGLLRNTIPFKISAILIGNKQQINQK